MLKIGLTGGIGSGKSLAAEMFKQLGVPVIDADCISHEITAPGAASLHEISEKLGPDFITSENTLDRKKLADYIFKHAEKKALLEAILHPRIRQKMLHEVEKLGTATYAILVVPLLFETGFIELVDRVLVIDAPMDTRIERIRLRDARDEEQIRNILKSQLDQSVKAEKADDVLDNSGSPEQLQSSVNRLHGQYLKLAGRSTPG